jgi:hypothetical protein
VGEEEDESAANSKNVFTAYHNDLSYCQDQILLTRLISKISRDLIEMESVGALDDEDAQQHFDYKQNFRYDPHDAPALNKEQAIQKNEVKLRKLRQKEKILRNKITQRLALTKEKGGWFPRFERLASTLALSPFERLCIIHVIGNVISPPLQGLDNPYASSGGPKTKCYVSLLLQSFCSSLEEQMKCRKYFYKNSTLVQEGIFSIMGLDFMSDLTECEVEIDRRMLDFVVGLGK